MKQKKRMRVLALIASMILAMSFLAIPALAYTQSAPSVATCPTHGQAGSIVRHTDGPRVVGDAQGLCPVCQRTTYRGYDKVMYQCSSQSHENFYMVYRPYYCSSHGWFY